MTFQQPISAQIHANKYAFGSEQNSDETFLRVAKSIASVEKEPELWAEKFFNIMKDFSFIPAGRIISGAGTGRKVTLFNCYVNGNIPDSMNGIMDNLKEASLTMQQGGGIGYNFSTIRPKGALVKGVGSDASGPLSFMDMWDTMCKTIMSAGARRGAMMGVLNVDHPDVEEFILAKQDPLRFRNFNLSVACTDAFMEAVREDKDWNLVFEDKVYKTIKAVDLWNKIMDSTYKAAEPGVMFIDTVNKNNPLNYIERIHASNPCGEQYLPPYGACLLGSLNLAKFINFPFDKEKAVFDYDRFYEVATTATRLMDNVIDCSNFPLVNQKKEAYAKRRIGIGITGLADALVMLGIKYGSDDSITFVRTVLRSLYATIADASADLAAEKGAFPEFDKRWLDTSLNTNLPIEIKRKILKNGIRNGQLTSIAPTGTISLLANNVSSGIEPIFAQKYTRKVLQKDGTKTEEEVYDYAYKLYMNMFGKEPEFETAQTLAPMDHLKVQAEAQKYVDNAISKTINLPEDISFDEFKSVYMTAWELGCKGCTTYRPNEITGSVLSVEPEKKKEPVVSSPTLRPRPHILTGKTYKEKFLDDTLYITINEDEEGIPFELFITSKNVDSKPWTDALSRIISSIFRKGGDISYVSEELKSVFDPSGGAWLHGKYVPSKVALIGTVIDSFLAQEPKPVNDPQITTAPVQGKICKSCHQPTVIKDSGCEKCTSCGDSKCG